MAAQIIDGNAIAKSIRAELTKVVDEWQALGHRQPGLAVILVGNDPASEVYVKGKRRDCEQVGVHSTALHLPENTRNRPLRIISTNSTRMSLLTVFWCKHPCPRILMKIASLTVSSQVRMWMDSTPITLGAWPCAVQSYAAARLRE